MTIKEFEIQLALGSLTDNMKRKLAENPNTPVEILTTLSTDKYWDVRWSVANNPNTPAETLTILSTDEDSDVRYWVASNPNTSLEVLAKLATDKNRYVRSCAAEIEDLKQIV